MDDISSAVSVTVSLSSSSCDNSGILGPVEMTQLKLVSETSNLLFPSVSVSNWDISCNTLTSQVDYETMATQETEAEEIVLDVSNENDSNETLPLDDGSELSLPIAVEIETIEEGRIVGKVICLGEPSAETNAKIDVLTVSSPNVEVIQLSGEKKMGIIGTKSVLKVDCVPLWGSVSICGMRPEMEDAVVTVPRFMKIPIEMFTRDHVMNGLSRGLTHMNTHFFGVYDGHGGFQVAEYCRDRMHFALGEELKDIAADFLEGRTSGTLQREWENVFSRCFNKVDEEVSRRPGISNTGENLVSTGHLQSIAPDTAGSTAVVALVCSSHIVVANCGDSRAVLYRGKESIALSVDHKPNREDEYARIEASGGKVIQWNGHRLFGVLAMSRAIGDTYMKPWIIPEPEVTFVPRKREDECLIIASDGLWDIISNEEACEVARRRILLWHKKNGDSLLAERGQGVDPAAQSAAEYLSAVALQKGSKDNISVIVVDLKAQRKFKTKT